MKLFSNWLDKRESRLDARARIKSIDDRITARHGLRPAFDPVHNAEHGELARVLADRVRVEELREDVARAEDDLVGHAPALLLTLGFMVALGMEVWGCLMVMREIGVSPAERLPLGIALALAVVGVTSVAAHRTSGRPRGRKDEEGAAVRLLLAAKRSVWTTVILVAYTLVIGALAILRVLHATSEDAPMIEVVAQGLLLVATSVGPAWIAEWLYRLRQPSRHAAKHLSMVRRRLHAAERAWSKAQAESKRIARAGARWDSEAAQHRARYETVHRLESTKVTNEQSPKTRASRA